MTRGRTHTPIVATLRGLIAEHDWAPRFDAAVQQLVAQAIPALAGIRTLDDYLAFIDDMVAWAPRERTDSLLVHDKLVTFHFLLDQPALRPLQSPRDAAVADPALTQLTAGSSDSAGTWGARLDTT
ncbi:MAG: phosphatidylserine decarboxylase, partial [Caulobacter sp.]|nr:phosphatidylserine decarboxylase [Vitreoscilla sp.]